MKDKFAIVFGGVLALVLLALYAGPLAYMIVAVYKAGHADPTKQVEFGTGLVLVVTTVGALVSSLVIAKLAITQPDDNPIVFRRLVRANGSQPRFVTTCGGLYVSIWFLVGLGALVVGVMVFPEVNQTVNDIGTSWLGLAISAVFAYFGIKP